MRKDDGPKGERVEKRFENRDLRMAEVLGRNWERGVDGVVRMGKI